MAADHGTGKVGGDSLLPVDDFLHELALLRSVGVAGPDRPDLVGVACSEVHLGLPESRVVPRGAHEGTRLRRKGTPSARNFDKYHMVNAPETPPSTCF